MNDTKEDILLAAHKHFALRGYNVSMSDIAKAVGIKTPSLYSHFSGKDEIIYLIVQRQVTSYTDFLTKVYVTGTDLSLRKRLEDIYYSIVNYYQDYEKLRFWRNILLIDNEELGVRCSKLLFDLEMLQLMKMKTVIAEYVPAAESDTVEGNALMLLGIIQGVLEGMLLCHGTVGIADGFIDKIWKAYEAGILQVMCPQDNH